MDTETQYNRFVHLHSSMVRLEITESPGNKYSLATFTFQYG